MKTLNGMWSELSEKNLRKDYSSRLTGNLVVDYNTLIYVCLSVR